MRTIANPSLQPDDREAVTAGNSVLPSRRAPDCQQFDAAPAPPSPARELARRALDVLRRARPVSPPERWLQPGFGREGDLVRLHLAPLRTRAALAGSFGREAFNMAFDDGPPGWRRATRIATPGAVPIGPVHVAYALRWLELGDGRRRGAFIDWLADPAERTLR